MTTLVTALMYSGRPNPTWELNDDQTETLKKLLGEKKEITFEMSPVASGILGYRGFEIESFHSSLPAKLFCFDGIIDMVDQTHLNFIDKDSNLENFLLETSKQSLTDLEKNLIQGEISKNSKGGPGSISKLFKLSLEALVPPFDPGKWNIPSVQRFNNCYNYANDKITNTFAQPGRCSGSPADDWKCAPVGQASQRDGEIPISSPPAATPQDGHFIALVSSDIWQDYHWYRLDSNAMWSHKPGQTPATNLDNGGKLISDPRTCNRGVYTNFCGFYHCIPSKTTIR